MNKKSNRRRSPHRTSSRAIARRSITVSGAKDGTVDLSLRIPRVISGPRWAVWECPISIKGLAPAPIKDTAKGVDSLQALILGVECLRWHLVQSGANFEWLGDYLLGGTSGGIPRMLPIGMGKEFDERLDAAINREAEGTRKFRAKHMGQLLAEAGISTSTSLGTDEKRVPRGRSKRA